MEKILEVHALYKQFADICAVDQVSFEANKGEIIALLGPNGAGKSTLMNMIAGYLAPNGGDVFVTGINMEQNPIDAKSNIGFLAEGAPLYGDMSTAAFLDYMADLKGLDKAQKKQRLLDVQEMAQISTVWHKKIETLSKGYQRRVGFAQSLLSDPPLLLLDEPTDGLDPNQKDHIRHLIKELGKNKTIIISTHLLDDVSEMCNRIMLMNKGCIVADGTMQDILQHSEKHSLEDAFRYLTGGQYA
ncbi:MAG: ATP-binding cassette domain-containing protein [Alphaproteobacteria bacterium]|nr:ATP-binding cassette domain-containing protein [Alphaproteobacteria bacterium]